MDADLARFLREELGHAPGTASGPWDVRGPMWLWQGSDGAPAKGSWYFLTIDGDTAAAIRAAASGSAAAWGSVAVEATIGATTWRTSLFPSKSVAGWLLPLKAAVRKAERLVEGGEISVRLALTI